MNVLFRAFVFFILLIFLIFSLVKSLFSFVLTIPTLDFNALALFFMSSVFFYYGIQFINKVLLNKKTILSYRHILFIEHALLPIFMLFAIKGSDLIQSGYYLLLFYTSIFTLIVGAMVGILINTIISLLAVLQLELEETLRNEWIYKKISLWFKHIKHHPAFYLRIFELISFLHWFSLYEFSGASIKTLVLGLLFGFIMALIDYVPKRPSKPVAQFAMDDF